MSMVHSFHVDYIVGTRWDSVLITARLVRTTRDSLLSALTFTTRNHVTLKSCDFLVNTSRRYESEEKNTRIMEKSITTCYTIVSLCMQTFWWPRYDKNTHDLWAREHKLHTLVIPHEMNAPLLLVILLGKKVFLLASGYLKVTNITHAITNKYFT